MRKLLLVIFVLGLTARAHASSVVQMHFVDVGPGNYDGSLSNFYVYPYNFSIDNSPTLVSLMCDDFNDDIYFGETWQANRYKLSDIIAGNGQMTPSAGSLAGLNNQSRTRAYEEAAWLFEELNADPTKANSVGINHTVWALFANTPFANNAVIQSWFTAASNATNGLTDAQAEHLFSNIDFYTPIPNTQSTGGRPQEFIGASGPSIQNVPEPAGLTLLLPGLLGLGSIVRRKVQK